jgi:2-Cys peroxiredoxin 5
VTFGAEVIRNRVVEGNLIPEALLGRLEGGELRAMRSVDLFRGHRSIVMGVPGAFTPVCTQRHVPDFVDNADALRRAGFTQLICIAPNDPFVLDMWSRMLDPGGRIKFVSDGNLEFNRALGLLSEGRSLFLGTRSERYLLVIDNGTIAHLRIEPNAMAYSCTRAADAMEVALV